MRTDTTIISRRKRQEFTVGAKVTLTALTVMGFIGTWNIIARMESRAALADEMPPEALPAPAQTAIPIRLTPTPWPTIPALTELPLIPDLNTEPKAFFGPSPETVQLAGGGVPATETRVDFAQIAPIPTLGPLPALEPIAPFPEIPRPSNPNAAASNGHHSGGS
jgi:hypothetical protein